MPKKEKKTEKEKKEAKKAKQVEKVEKKALKRNKKELKDAGEDDIEKIIADFSKRENSKTAVTVEVCSQPSPRSNFTLTGLSNGEMILFGGEFSDGQGTVVFNNLYRWNLDKNEWKHIESLNTPPPRCSHQAVFYKDKLYVIGGEYATLDQFHHYKDFWALDIKTNTWTEIKATGDVPSARSGHRVCIWRGYLVLFGGFYEAMRELKWFNDIFFYSFQEERWTQVKYKPSAQVPRARSGVQMFVHSAEEVLYIYGGFSKEKLPGVTKEGRVHEDMWMMNLKTLLTTAGSSALGGKASLDTSKAVWQRVSRKGYFPSTRCGSSMTVYKNKAILFGGVFDDEGQQHSLNSMFYNEMYAFDMERKRWYQLGVKRVKVNTNGSEVKLTPAGVKEQKKVIADAARLKSDAEDDSDDSEGGEKEVNDEQLVEDTEIGDQNEDIDGEQLVDGDFFGYIDDSGAVVYLDMEEEEGVTSPKEASIPTPQAVTSVKVAELKSSATSISTTPIKAPSLSPPPLDHDMGEQKVSELVSTLFIQESPVLAVAGNIKSFIAEPVAPPPPVSISRYFQDRAEPSPRINPSLIVRGNTLHLYGGLTELGVVEVTLDDCWSIDLSRRDKWRCVLPGTMHSLVWRGENDDGTETSVGDDGSDKDSDDSDADEASSDSDSDDEEGDGEKSPRSKQSTKKTEKPQPSRREGGMAAATGVRAEMQQLREELGAVDANRTPQFGETLRTFFARTTEYWIAQAAEKWREQNSVESQEPLSEKELKKEGFMLAEIRFSELAPVLSRLNELEAQQAGEEQDEPKSSARGTSSRGAGHRQRY